MTGVWALAALWFGLALIAEPGLDLVPWLDCPYGDRNRNSRAINNRRHHWLGSARHQ